MFKKILIATVFWLITTGMIGNTWAQNKFDPNCDPANLLLVVDVSGSMLQGGKLDGLKQALQNVIQQFQTKLRMGLITFGTRAELVVEMGPSIDGMSNPQVVAAQVQKLLAAVQNLKANGATPMVSALETARDHYKAILPSDPLHQDPEPLTQRRSFVLLATDGEPTDGDPLPIIKELRSLQVGNKQYDIRTFVVGLGSGQDIRIDQLKRYAIQGGTDDFLHALTAEDLEPFFQGISEKASQEVCNGRDDDCDGLIDEDLERECRNICGVGIEICHKGKWSECSAPQPLEEVCNGLDDNCNGEVDEGLIRPCETACGKGFQTCIQGDWTSCSAPMPQPEVCDGTDNDCDGQIDNGALCPGGECVPIGGGGAKCVIPCRGGECPAGYTCNHETKMCMEGPCVGKQCKPGEVCTEEGGQAICKNICANVNCPAGLTCGRNGTCVDCYQEPCAPQMLCLEGRCVVDQCATQACDINQGCRDGKCFDTCAGKNCAAGSKCQNGLCVPDLCANTKCQANEICINGKCLKNKCMDASAPQCGPKQYCEPESGMCKDDPCARTHCPPGVSCYLGQCGLASPKPTGQQGSACKQTSDCTAANMTCKNGFCVPLDNTIGPGGGQGCGCSSHSQPYWPPFFILIFWLSIIILRRNYI
jgi:uncharacterized protein YegL